MLLFDLEEKLDKIAKDFRALQEAYTTTYADMTASDLSTFEEKIRELTREFYELPKAYSEEVLNYNKENKYKLDDIHQDLQQLKKAIKSNSEVITSEKRAS